MFARCGLTVVKNGDVRQVFCVSLVDRSVLRLFPALFRFFLRLWILFSVLLVTSVAAFAQSAPPNQHPLALLHDSLTVESGRVVSHFALDGALAWSNTFNEEEGVYLIDSESVVFTPTARMPVNEWSEVFVTVPVITRGGGVLDHTIEEWDGALGYEGERVDAPQDDYRVEIATEDGGLFALPEQGTALGAVAIGAKVQVSSAPIAVLARLRLPTAGEGFGAPGIDSTVQAIGEVQRGALHLTAGGGVTVVERDEYRALRFSRVQGGAFLTARYPLSEEWRGVVTVLGHSAEVRNVSGYPAGDLYIDVGVERVVASGHMLGVFVRENPLYPADTTDVTFFVNWVIYPGSDLSGRERAP